MGSSVASIGSLATTLVIAAVIAVTIVVALIAITSFLYICPPNEVLIFSGQRHKTTDGSTRGFRVVFGGRGWRFPLLEEAYRMRLNVTEIPISIRGAYSKGSIPLSVDAIANIKISSNRALIGNAIERFLGQPPQIIARVAKETLEGHLRGVLATLTPEEVNEDRLKFAESLRHESEEDLNKLGLHLDTLKIQNVSDEVQYLDSIGREAIAKVIKDAEIAESDCKRDAEKAEAEAAARANVTKANVDAAVAKMKNDLRRIRAELESKVKSEEERTEAAARQARAEAEQELQTVRAQLAEIRLQADQVLPAEADRLRQEYVARGEAASIRERGSAVAETLDVLNQAWAQAGENASAIYLMEDFEHILETAAKGVSKVKIQNLNMIDGGDGSVLSSYVSAYPAMLAALFDAIAKTTGIDIPKTVARGASNGVAGGSSEPNLTSTQPSGPASEGR